MTKRSELQHRFVEFKAKLEVAVANRLFSLRRNRLDRILKAAMRMPQRAREET